MPWTRKRRESGPDHPTSPRASGWSHAPFASGPGPLLGHDVGAAASARASRIGERVLIHRVAAAATAVSFILGAGLIGGTAATSAGAAVVYDAVLEWNGPHFRVIHAPATDQLVDNPAHDLPFAGCQAVAAREHGAGERDVVYVADTGRNRIQVFEVNAVYRSLRSSELTWAGAGATAASQWDSDQINLPEWAASAARFVVPFSEVVKVSGTPCTRVADLSGFTALDRVYAIDYSDPTQAPVITFPSSSLSETSAFEISYATSDEHTGSAPSFGIGDVDYGIGAGLTPALVTLDPSSGGPDSWQEIAALALIENEITSTTDDLFVLDGADDSAAQNEELFGFAIAVNGSVSYVEAYDDRLTAPRDVAVARSGASSPATVMLNGDTGPFDKATATVADANQVTGHTYSATATLGAVTITDVTTGRVLVSGAPFPSLADPFRGIPGLSLPLNPGAGASVTITTTRAVSRRYLFVADTGADRIKVIEAGDGDGAAWPGNWLPGDAHTGMAQPTGAGTVGATAGHDYWYTTPAIVPEDYFVYTNARPVKEGSCETITFDPAGTPVAWTRVDDLEAAGPADPVFEVDWFSGRIVFGDGVHGRTPPAATPFQFDYTTTPDLLRFGSSGTGNGQFNRPEGIAARWNQGVGVFDVYVADTGNNRIQKFAFHPATLNLPARLEHVCQWSTATSPSDSLDRPVDVTVAVDKQKSQNGKACYIAVSDEGNDRIVIYQDGAANSGGSSVPEFDWVLGGAGASLGTFGRPGRLTFLQNRDDLDLYAADPGRGVVTRFQEAPGPAIELDFTGSSSLPRCFPPSSGYPIRFSTSNPPEGGWVDFYFDTAPVFNISTARLCITSGTVSPDEDMVMWRFSATPDGPPDDHPGYYLFARMKDAAGLTVAVDQAQVHEVLCLDADVVPALSVTDLIDGDRTLYLQNGQDRIVALEISYPESVIAVGFSGAFDTSLVEITGITPGNAWDGAHGVSQVFTEAHDNGRGTLQVNSAVTGSPIGLVDPGPHVIALVSLRARENAITTSTRFRNGSLALDQSACGITCVNGGSPESWSTRSLNLRLARLGDIATTGAGADSSVPHLAPKPDGKIDFADQMTFTLGWNGRDNVRDRIADLGPAPGQVPELDSQPDGAWNLDDILAFTAMFSWAGADSRDGRPAARPEVFDDPSTPAGHPLAVQPVPASPRFTSGDGPLAVEARLDPVSTPAALHLDVGLAGVDDVTGVWLRVGFDSAVLDAADCLSGGFLRGGAGEMFLRRFGSDAVEVGATRLDPRRPGQRGSGLVASLGFSLAAGFRARPDATGTGEPLAERETGAMEDLVSALASLEIRYELYSSTGALVATGLARPGSGTDDSATITPRLIVSPNPTSGPARILFDLERSADIEMDLHDPAGRRVRSLTAGSLSCGSHAVEFDGRDEAGRRLARGIYFVRLRTGAREDHRKLVITR